MAETSKRSEQFKKWLIDLTPEKVELLVELEKNARLINHAFRLMGESDTKLVKALSETSDKVRLEYENQAA